MMTAFLTAHANFLFWLGAAIETVGGVWFLFDSYRCDVALARWTLLFPPIALFLVFRYPAECLKSFLVCVLGFLFLWVGQAYSPDKGGPLHLPSAVMDPDNS